MIKSTFKFLFLFISILFFSFTLGCKKSSSTSKNVVVYTYDSFAADWGSAPLLKEAFEKNFPYTVEFVDCGDAIECFYKIQTEGKDCICDVIVGIDNNYAGEVISSGILEKYKAKNVDKLLYPFLQEQLSKDYYLTPYDFSHFALIYDTKSSIAAPEKLSDLTKDVYSKKIVLMDPRTSTPGLGFVAWTSAVFSDSKFDSFWKNLKPNILSMTPSWSHGWGMFLQGEAPLVISYTTSPAYCIEEENNDRYIALEFSDGHVMQVEGAGLLKTARNKEGAKAFIDFLISDEAQVLLPKTQWMYPSNKNIELPESYKKAAPLVQKTLFTDEKKVKEKTKRVIKLLNEN